MYKSAVMVLLLSCVLPPLQAAPVYSWKDSNGGTHFGTQPPEGTQAEPVSGIVVPDKRKSDTPTKSSVSKEQAPNTDKIVNNDKQKELDGQVKKEVEEKNEERQATCEKIRANLAQLRGNPRVRVKDEDGTVRKLTEEDRQKRITDIEKTLTERCD